LAASSLNEYWDPFEKNSKNKTCEVRASPAVSSAQDIMQEHDRKQMEKLGRFKMKDDDWNELWKRVSSLFVKTAAPNNHRDEDST
jgi:hypothetical protein